jgi:hypothetical protein
MSELHSFIIVGVTNRGEKFRPSDWADRISGVLSAFGATKKTRYSSYASPGEYGDEKAVYVDGALRQLDPDAYAFLLNFAQDNDLRIIDSVCPIPSRKQT